MKTLYDFNVKTIDGDNARLARFRGKVMLVVNVASQCGLTPQYEQLQALYRHYHAQGFEVLGFPCNQFGGQEPGNEAEIREFCTLNYDVTFPMFAKLNVNGEERHPLYRYLIEHQPVRETLPDGQLKPHLLRAGLLPEEETEVLWNFEKFLVNREGRAIARFSPDMTPQNPLLIRALEQALHQEVQLAS